MKFLILDHDGVIVTSQCRGTENKWGKPPFDRKCVGIVNHIITQIDCEIIVSSDWRHDLTLHEIRDMYNYYGIIKTPIGYTPSLKNYNGMNLDGGRADEIKLWVKTYAWKDDTKWVAVDDYKLEEHLYPNFVWCPNHMEGIKQTGILEKILDKLN